MMNFDRYNNANQHTELINDSIKSIELESERLEILRSQKVNRNFFIFFDNEMRDHKMLLSYYQKDACHKLDAIDPHLHFDLHYIYARKELTPSDLTVLHHFIDHYLFTNLKVSKPPEEKECNNFQKRIFNISSFLMEISFSVL